MIKIPREIVDEIFEHGNRDMPNEACGYLAGSDDEVVKRIPLTNIDHSPEHFSFDPKEQFVAFKDAKKELGDIPFVIISNKVDLEVERQISTKEGKKKAEELCSFFIETSALYNKNVIVPKSILISLYYINVVVITTCC